MKFKYPTLLKNPYKNSVRGECFSFTPSIRRTRCGTQDERKMYRTTSTLLHSIAMILAMLLPSMAFAHIGADAGIHHGSAFIMGLAHPFTGLDHMGAMLTVGIWSMLVFNQTQHRVWVAPIAFAVFIAIGGMLGFAGVGLPIVEPMIAASLLVLGLLVAMRARLPLMAGVLIVGAFAIFHGIAHGSELSADKAVAALSGMVLATMILHLSGMALARFVLQRNVWLSRIAGGMVALLGAGLLSGAL